jgi:putative DNA primase/helicase
MLDAALDYAARGWAVIPLAPGGKIPSTVHGSKDATTDAVEIREWWTQHPHNNIGIATGSISGIAVLDVDTRNGKAGGASLLHLISKHSAIPETLRQRTWSGGLHYVFQSVPGLKNSGSALGDGLDIKSDGGYIVAAPSVVNGRSYAWENEGTEPAPMPVWIAAPQPLRAPTSRRSGSEWAAQINGVLQGSRQDELSRWAGYFLAKHAPEIARELLRDWAGKCDPPLSAKEADGCIDRIIRLRGDDLVIEPDDDPGGERFTDMANAKRLQDVAAERAGHVGEMKDKWYIFDGGRLVLDFKAAMYPFNAEVAERLFVEASLEDARRKELEARVAEGNLVSEVRDALKHRIEESEARSATLGAGAQKMESRTGGDAAIELAKSLPGLRLKLDQLDTHPTWLNTPSGTLDLDTMDLHPHRFPDLLTKMAGAAYDPGAKCPRWDSFLEEVVPDIEVRAFLQRSLGLALTDITREQCLWFLYGLGRNGKTTLLNAVRYVLGDYAASTKASTLMVKQHGDEKRNDVAILRGARFVSATEAEDGQKMAEALIKEITGEDPVTARLLYAEFFTFKPTFKIFLAANHKPIISGVDLGIWRRIHLVPFEQNIPESKVDGLLPVALKAEGSGILNWLIAGYRAYAKGGLQVPQPVRAATAAYRHESDPLADFLEEACFVEPGLECTASALYDAYTRWAQANGVRFPLKARSLGQQLDDRGFKPHKGSGGTRFRRGLLPRA